MGERITIQDIARLAKVSTGTVSRVLNNKPDVDPLTRERILQIMKEQGYVPSITAAGLATGHSRLISVLVPALTWPLISELMLSVARFLNETAYEIVLYSINAANHERDCSRVIDRVLATGLTAGLLAVFPGQSRMHLMKLHRHGFPMVLIDDQNPPIEGVPWVGADNRGGAYQATRYLAQLGHRRIAYIQGPMKYKVSHDRYDGYCDALQEVGIDLDPTLILEGDFEPTGGYSCARAFFARPPAERPTAIFAGSDLMAYGVISAAQECGLRIPGDIALMGFDDNPSSAHMQPTLTTIQQPFAEMGRRAIELLLHLIDQSCYPQRNQQDHGGMLGETPRIQLPTSLKIRESCGASLSRASNSIVTHQPAP